MLRDRNQSTTELATSIVTLIVVPSTVGILAWAIVTWLAIWIFMPIHSTYKAGLFGLAVFLAFLVMLSIGAILGFRRLRSREVALCVSFPRLCRVVSIFFYLGCFGLLARVSDRIVRGGSFTAGFIANREELQSQSFGILAVIGLLFGTLLLFLPLLVFLKRASGHRSLRDWFYLAVSACYPLVGLLLMGSRSGVLVFAAMIILSALVTRRIRITFRGVLLVGVVTFALVWFGGYIFAMRTQAMGLSPIQSLTQSSYAHFVVPDAGVQALLYAARSSLVGSLAYSAVNFGQYYTHGVFEFSYLVNVFHSYHTWGAQTFFVPIKLLSRIAGISGFTNWAFGNQVRVGIYTTVMGPIFYDFGIFGGGIACFVIGYLLGAIGRRIAHSSPHWLPLYVFLMVPIFFAPVVSLLVNGGGETNWIVGIIASIVLCRSRAIGVMREKSS